MSFLRYKKQVEVGDTVMIYLDIHSIYPLCVTSGSVFQTKYGALKHDSLVGHRFGTAVSCSKGWAYVLYPTPEMWTLSLPHRTQILYTADISLIIFLLDLGPGKVVCEAGTGSGSMSHALARALAPNGKLHTCDFHKDRTQQADEEFKLHGLSDVVSCCHRDICTEGFPVDSASADAVFLDLPNPWQAIPWAARALRNTGRVCSFSPCIEQVQKTTNAMSLYGFDEVETYECLLRPFEVKKAKGSDVPAQAFPSLQAPGHTGFLTFATRVNYEGAANQTSGFHRISV